jgi:hypothetical protein
VEIEKAIASEWATGTRYAVMANSKHPKLKTVFDALQTLDHYLLEEMPAPFMEELESKLEMKVDVRNREYFADVLFRGRYFPD